MSERRFPSPELQSEYDDPGHRDAMAKYFLPSIYDFPVTFEQFKEYSYYDETLDIILGDLAADIAHQQMCICRSDLLRDYYSMFYITPEIRTYYPLRLKPCPLVVKKLLLLRPYLDSDEEDVRREAKDKTKLFKIPGNRRENMVCPALNGESSPILQQPASKRRSSSIDNLYSKVCIPAAPATTTVPKLSYIFTDDEDTIPFVPLQKAQNIESTSVFTTNATFTNEASTLSSGNVTYENAGDSNLNSPSPHQPVDSLAYNQTSLQTALHEEEALLMEMFYAAKPTV